MALRCPRDGATLEEMGDWDALVGVCPQCKGMFASQDFVRQSIAGADRAAGVLHLARRNHDIACPFCDTTMRTLETIVEPVVQIEECPECGGWWLDRGELEAIRHHVARFAAQAHRARRQAGREALSAEDFALPRSLDLEVDEGAPSEFLFVMLTGLPTEEWLETTRPAVLAFGVAVLALIVHLVVAIVGDPAQAVQAAGLVPGALVQQPWRVLTAPFVQHGWAELFLGAWFFALSARHVEFAMGRAWVAAVLWVPPLVSALVEAAAGHSSGPPVSGLTAPATAALGAYVVLFPAARVRIRLLIPWPFPVGVAGWVLAMPALLLPLYWIFLLGVVEVIHLLGADLFPVRPYGLLACFGLGALLAGIWRLVALPKLTVGVRPASGGADDTGSTGQVAADDGAAPVV